MLDHDRIDTGSDEAAADAAAMGKPESPANPTAASAAGGPFDELPLSSGKRDQLRGGIFSPTAALKVPSRGW